MAINHEVFLANVLIEFYVATEDRFSPTLMRLQLLFAIQAAAITKAYYELFDLSCFWVSLMEAVEGSQLPPHQSCDHQILLKDEAALHKCRLYRYPHHQKNEIEKQVRDMLHQGIIQASSSLFSAPVILVKKHDGSWRFCVDCRVLNQSTMKHKFPIPVIEELLDELWGAKFFTKLDLRTRYHQIRMKDNDVYKTAFQTYQGWFKFLVMSFGLTNVPATFQRLMNNIFLPQLRRFILVFFDDILVNSKSWEEHLQHLQVTFTILSKHQLFLEKSKFGFARTSID